MRIAYVHGFASAGSTPIVSVIRKYMKEDEVYAYDVPVEPYQAIHFLRDRLFEDDIDVAIGTSLGAFYLLHTFGCAKIVVNPPIDPNRILDDCLNREVPFLNPREDGAKTFLWQERYHKQLEFYKEQLIDWDPELVPESFFYFGTEDTVVRDGGFQEEFWIKTYIPGGHRLTEEMFVTYLMPMVEEIRRMINEKREK